MIKHNHKHRYFWPGIILTTVVVCAISIYLYVWKDQHESIAGNSPILQSNPVSETKSTEVQQKITPEFPPDIVAATYRSAASDIDKLLKDGSPEGAFKALKIIERCVQLFNVKKSIASLPISGEMDDLRKRNLAETEENNAYCESVSQRQMMDRTLLIEKAVVARIPGAAALYYAAGPNGQPDDLALRPDDQGVLAWKAKAIEYLKIEADSGGIDAIAQLASIYSGQMEKNDQNISLSLGYELALRDIKISTNANVAQVNNVISSLKIQASQNDIAAAQELEKSIMSKCCKNN